MRAEVARLRRDLQVKLEISSERVLTELSKLAFFDVRRVFNEDGTLKAISELDSETAASIAGLDRATVQNTFRYVSDGTVLLRTLVQRFGNHLPAKDVDEQFGRARAGPDDCTLAKC